MNITRSLCVAAALVGATIVVGAWTYLTLPQGAFLPIHQGFGGPATAHLGKGLGLSLMPAIAILVVGLLSVVPRMAPDRIGLERSAAPYGLMIVGLAGVFLVTQIALAERMRRADFDVLRPVFLSVAVLLAMIGNYLGKVRHNHVFGVRTPWTLADARVWDKTRRLAGRLMVLGAAGLAAASLLVRDPRLLIALMALFTAGPPLWAAAHSRRIWRQEQSRQV